MELLMEFFYLPDGISNLVAISMIVLSFFTSFLSAAFSIGGGIVMLAVLSPLLPTSSLIPVHGIIQLGSNFGRAILLFKYIKWNTILPYSTLARKDGSIVYNDLHNKLHINVEYRDLNITGERRCYWFRFTSVINIDEPRSTKRRRTSNNERVEINASQDNMAPGSDDNRIALYKLYDEADKHGLLVDHNFISEELCTYITQQEEAQQQEKVRLQEEQKAHQREKDSRAQKEDEDFVKKFHELKERMKTGLVLAWLQENEKDGHITFKEMPFIGVACS